MRISDWSSDVCSSDLLDSLAIVDQISFHHLGKLCGPLAAEIGANPAINYQSAAPHGDTPVRLLNEAANRIGAGEVKLAAVVGGEALRTAAGRAAKAASGEDRKSTRRTRVTNAHLVCRLMLEKKNRKM